jgi:hypothetical protein
MTRSARKAWTTAQKNRARDRAAHLGNVQKQATAAGIVVAFIYVVGLAIGTIERLPL